MAGHEATVSYPAAGSPGLFGWVQLVRSTDNASGGRSSRWIYPDWTFDPGFHG